MAWNIDMPKGATCMPARDQNLSLRRANHAALSLPVLHRANNG
jgi:hypothetical protein